MGSHWSLSDSKSIQVSSNLLGILADLNNAVVWMVSNRPLISNSSSPCINSYTKSTNYNWHHRYFHVSLLFQFPCKVLLFDFFHP